MKRSVESKSATPGSESPPFDAGGHTQTAPSTQGPVAARGEGGELRSGTPSPPTTSSWLIRYATRDMRVPVMESEAVLQYGQNGVIVRYLNGGSIFFPYSAIESIEYTP